MMEAVSVLSAGLLAGGQAFAAGDEELFLRTPQAALSGRVTANGFTGPTFQLYRSPSQIRGRANGQPVSLALQEEQVSGLVGSLPVRMRVHRQGEQVTFSGTFAGRFTQLEWDAQKLTGTLGRCGYELRFVEGRYEGERSCGGLIEAPVVLEIPQALAREGDVQVAAVLALVLGV
ncbi:hypothetical protein POL68_23130 [Stigmatella sp. ncwal1]|uniref:Uncharacterized protein n=1 Tax=Stigmatella ashevillensis TaxID=2995309 RepID=A0ABT5DCN3_9BACT|nr:hypothetical protein [Stigmatella ashevillena]MDC0711383.1 hypothetical protein [Stigmatella ashevillena]